ncbi:MAG: hypothetical protein AAFX06_00135 [Planctomycetota bacterium]
MKRILLGLLCLTPIAPCVAGDAGLFPPSTVIYAELSHAKELADTLYEHPLRARIEALPAYQQFTESAQFRQFEQGRSMAEGMIGMPIREAIETFLAQGASVGFDAESESFAAVVRGKDAKTMRELRDKALAIIALANEGAPVANVEYRGIEAHRANDLRLAVYEDRMLLTNSSDLGKAVIDRMLDGGGSLADSEGFQEAIATKDGDATLWAYANVDAIRSSGEAQEIYEQQIDNPVAEALLGGIQSNLQHTQYATATVLADKQTVSVELATPHEADWIPEEREYYFGPEGNGRAPAITAPDQTLFTLSTYRDLSEMWLRAGDLFGPETNDQFAQADAGLTTIFAGRDFGEEILGSLSPEVAFIATRQDFSGRNPIPALKLPSFAIIAELRDPEKMRRELRRTFQSTVGFFNVVGAMNGLNQLELDIEKLDAGAEVVTASYVAEEGQEESTEAPVQFNFSPTVGFAGDRFILSSEIGLAKTLTLAKESDQGSSDNTWSNLNAETLRDILSDNREQLIANNMLEEGNDREEAEAAIDLLLDIVGFFQDLSLRLRDVDDHLKLSLQLRVQQ